MNSCILVNYWADTEEKVDVVVRCISQLKKSGLKVFYSSVIPVNSKIQEVSDFVLHNKHNPIITMDDEFSVNGLQIFNTFSYNTYEDTFYAKELNHISVIYTLLLQIQRDIRFISELGYTHFHFFHGDNILVDSDIQTLIHLEKTCKALKKKAFFEDVSDIYYRTLYFFSEINFFLENSGTYESKFDFILKNINEWGNLNFERYIKLRFHPHQKYTILGNLGELSEDGAIYIFKDSKETVDLYSSYNTSTKVTIVPKRDYSSMDLYILVITPGKYKVLKNKEVILDFTESNYTWYRHNMPIEPFYLTVFKDDQLFLEMDLTEYKINKICKEINFYV